MVKIHCRTNLDLCHAEKWPEELPEVPRVGDFIQSAFGWSYYNENHHLVKGVRLELQVVRITWKYCDDLLSGKKAWIAEAELHLPPTRFENLTSFYEWYGKITGKGKSAFI